MVVEGDTVPSKYIPHTTNKKEILLNEPLRGLPNGAKDKFVKIGGKWFIERNTDCKDLVITKGTNWGQIAEGMIGFYDIIDIDRENMHSTEVAENIICDKLPSINRNQVATVTHEGIMRGNTYIGIVVKADNLETQDLDGLKKYIDSLNAKFIYNLATPVYEPLEIEPTLNTYNDTTYISNNSIIPCNMQIKNTGYNAIIKPSTLYTVAIDTDKNGIIGMNLAGAKVTTTNNVATITTPNTLTNDSLRLYGKGIKGSKVRLLEGDKTNLIPSFFEGMKSSFEDKVQEDGSYKMEVSMSNENLINADMIIKANPSSTIETINGENWLDTKNSGHYGKIMNIFEPNTQYTLYYKGKTDDGSWGIRPSFYYSDGSTQGCEYSGNGTLRTALSSKGKTVVALSLDVPWCFQMKNAKIHLDSLQLKKVDNANYVPHKSNKIQLSSIAPLRGVGNVHDRLVFKDGKLMIERNCKTFVLDGNTEGITYTRGFDGAKDTDTNMLFSMCASKEVLPIAGINEGCASGICNLLPNIYNKDVSTTNVPIGFSLRPYHSQNRYYINIRMDKNRMISNDIAGIKDWLNKNNLIIEFTEIEAAYK